MQLFPSISDTGGVPTALLPLGVVIVVSSLKDLAEDLRRHRSDAEENNRLVFVADMGNFRTKKWGELIVGDIVKIERNQAIPADLLILGTSGYSGIANVETKNLNGEANIERKVALPEVMRFFHYDEIVSHLKVSVSHDPPSARLDEFHGIINNIQVMNSKCVECILRLLSLQHLQPTEQLLKWDAPLRSPVATNPTVSLLSLVSHFENDSEDLQYSAKAFKNHFLPQKYPCEEIHLPESPISLTHDSQSANSTDFIIFQGPLLVDIGQFFLRGSTLVNTDWIYGLVIYVSRDTRIFSNANTQTQFKWSHLEKTYNHHVFVLIVLELVFCIIIGLCASLFHRTSGQIWYLGWFPNVKDVTSPSPSRVYGDPPEGVLLASFKVCLSMVILFAYFVPIDLFLMLEITRLCQGGFVTWDQEMMQNNEKSTHAISQGSHLLEELGNVTHLFTDKTGTLTRNVMTLRSVSIACRYLTSTKKKRENLESPCKNHSEKDFHEYPLYLSNDFCTITTSAWNDLLQSLREHTSTYSYARLFLLILSTCHTVLIREDPERTSSPDCCCFDITSYDSSLLPSFLEPQKLCLKRRGDHHEWELEYPPLVQYDASSPDELALVCSAQTCGVEFFSRSFLNRIQLRLLTESSRELILGPVVNSIWKHWVNFITNQQVICSYHSSPTHSICFVPLVTFELLDVLEFDSIRKRMSIILRDPIDHLTPFTPSSPREKPLLPNYIFRVLVKGADTHIWSAMAPSESEATKTIADHLNKIVEDGYRTLALAARDLSDQEYALYSTKLTEARTTAFKKNCIVSPKTSLVTKSLPYTSFATIVNQIESNLIVLGVTGVEDELQDDVPSVIRELRSCGIRVWMLTGDKTETAINIGYSTELLTDYTYNFIINEVLPVPLKQELKCILNKCKQLDLICESDDENTSCSLKAFQDVCDFPKNFTTPWYRKLVSRYMPSIRPHSKGKPSIPFISETFTAVLDTVQSRDKIGLPEHGIEYCNVINSSYLTHECNAVSNASLVLEKHCAEKTHDHESKIERDPLGLTSNNFMGVSELGRKSSDYQFSSPSVVQHDEKSFCMYETQSLSPTEDQFDKGFQSSEFPHLSQPKEFSLTVRGTSLEVILCDKELSALFFLIARYAVAVMACRVSPQQKALLVESSSRYNPRCASTLAIGDGANDVGMILSADVGIGIIGKEGLQAVRAADFGIKEFRFIRKLLFVHGREALRRNSFLIYYGIFKNIAFCIASFVFQFECGFSGQDIYNYWFKSLYATVFVAPTVLIYSIMDRQLPHYILHRSVITYHALPPVMWPVIELSSVKMLSYCFVKVKNKLFNAITLILHFLFFKNKPKTKHIHKLSIENATNTRKGTVPVGIQCYGTRLFCVWFVYGLYVGCIICLVPLHILNHATSVDHKTFTRETTFIKSEEDNTHSILEGKSGFDLYSVGMVVMFQCVLICNLVVALAINSFFSIQVILMVCNMLLFVGLWAITMWQPFVTNVFPSLNSVAGMFTMIWSCTAYYFCFFLLIFLCIIPIFTSRVLKVMFNPSVITIVKERMLQGVFDIVVARRSHAAQEIVVLVPQRHCIKRKTSAVDIMISRISTRQHFPSVGITKCESLNNQIVPSRVHSCDISSSRADPYAGFVFGYSETYTSSPPSIWTIATIVSRLGKTMEPLFSKVGRGVQQHLS